MSKTELHGNVATKSLTIEDNLSALALHGVSTDAKIKAVYNSNDGLGERTTIQTIDAGTIMEAIDKILYLTQRHSAFRRVKEVDNFDDSATLKVLQNAILPIANGQLTLQDGEEVNVSLTNLGKIKEDSYITTIETHSSASALLKVVKNGYNKNRDKVEVPISGSNYLVLEAANLPEFVEIHKNGIVKKTSIEDIKTQQEELFGLVRKEYMKNGDIVDFYGFNECILLPLDGVSKCVLHDEASIADYDYFTIKI